MKYLIKIFPTKLAFPISSKIFIHERQILCICRHTLFIDFHSISISGEYSFQYRCFINADHEFKFHTDAYLLWESWRYCRCFFQNKSMEYFLELKSTSTLLHIRCDVNWKIFCLRKEFSLRLSASYVEHSYENQISGSGSGFFYFNFSVDIFSLHKTIDSMQIGMNKLYLFAGIKKLKNHFHNSVMQVH